MTEQPTDPVGSAGEAAALLAGPRVARAWLARPSTAVAPDLLGCRIATADRVVVTILEVEAYDESEPASHTFRGRTPANAVMWGPAGHLYTYFTYGMHWCANVVTGEVGHGQAVLLRAAALEAGHDLVRARRTGRTGRTGAGQARPIQPLAGPASGTAPAPVSDRDLLRGPARLARGLGLGRADGGRDLLTDPDIALLPPADPPPAHLPQPLRVAAGPRVGVRLAADLPWRFWIADDPRVSPYRRHPRAHRPAGGPID